MNATTRRRNSLSLAAHTLGMVHLVLTMEKRVCIVRGGVHLSATVHEGGSSVPIHDGEHFMISEILSSFLQITIFYSFYCSKIFFDMCLCFKSVLNV